eukprot:PhM_4_TR9437/c0_g1_i1/m.60518
MSASQNVWEMLLEHERDKNARLEALSKKSETLITALQDENIKLQSQIRELSERSEAISTPQVVYKDDPSKEQEITFLKQMVSALEGQLGAAQAKLEEAAQNNNSASSSITTTNGGTEHEHGNNSNINNHNNNNNSKDMVPALELAAAQREVVRLNKRLNSCEKSLQDAMDERETLIMKLKSTQRTVMEQTHHNQLLSHSQAPPPHSPSVSPATTSHTEGSTSRTRMQAVPRRSPDRRAGGAAGVSPRTQSPTFRSNSPRFTRQTSHSSNVSSYLGQEYNSISQRVRKTSTTGTFSTTPRSSSARREK